MYYTYIIYITGGTVWISDFWSINSNDGLSPGNFRIAKLVSILDNSVVIWDGLQLGVSFFSWLRNSEFLQKHETKIYDINIYDIYTKHIWIYMIYI